MRNNSQKTQKTKAFGLNDSTSRGIELNNSSDELNDRSPNISKVGSKGISSVSAANDQTQKLISQSLIKMLQKKVTEMAKLADNEVMARSCVEKQMEDTQKEKEELESDNRVLA